MMLRPGEWVIDEHSPSHYTDVPVGLSKGRVAGYSSGAPTKPFPDSMLIDRAEWPDRINEKVKNKTQLSDLIIQAKAQGKMRTKNQNGTNYCWGHAPTRGCEVNRLVQGQPYVELSATSVCAQIVNYQNIGGWGTQALIWISEHGIMPVELWPANAINRKYATEKNKEAALEYRVTDWYQLEPRNLDQHISCLLHNIPVAVGLNWWGHEVLDLDAVWANNRIGARFDNSWGEEYGTGGMAVRQGNQLLADDAICPFQASASG